MAVLHRNQEKRILDSYPYPLAATYAKKMAPYPELEIEQAFHFHETLRDVTEVIIKYLAFLTLAQYRRDSQIPGGEDEELERSLAELKRPSLERLVALLRRALGRYSVSDNLLLLQLNKFYFAERPTSNPIYPALDAVADWLDDMPPVVSSTYGRSYADIIDALVVYRQKDAGWAAHRAVLGDNREYLERVQVLRPMLEQMLVDLDFLAQSIPVYVQSIKKRRDGAWSHNLRLLNGRNADMVINQVFAHALETEHIYLCQEEASSGALLPVLDVYPLMVWRDAEGYMINLGKANRLEYVSYSSGHRQELQEDTQYMRDFLHFLVLDDWRQSGSGDSPGAAAYIKALRDVLEDGVLYERERDKLDFLRQALNIPADEARRLEDRIKAEMHVPDTEPVPEQEKTVFISYRRSTSWQLAQLLYQNLKQHGYEVFLDVSTIPAGKFDEFILSQIKRRAHFVVLLSPHALERCVNDGDWLRREMEEAIRHKRNIVPVLDEGFSPDDEKQFLPEAWREEFFRLQMLPISNYYFDAAMQQLRERYLQQPQADYQIDPVLVDSGAPAPAAPAPAPPQEAEAITPDEPSDGALMPEPEPVTETADETTEMAPSNGMQAPATETATTAVAGTTSPTVAPGHKLAPTWSQATDVPVVTLATFGTPLRLLAVDENNKVVVYDESGAERYRDRLEGRVFTTATLEQSVLAGTWEGQLACFDRQGLRWQTRFNSPVAKLVVWQDQRVLAGTWTGQIGTFDADGLHHWSTQLDDGVSALAVSPDGAYIAGGSYAGHLVLLDRDGARLWLRDTQSPLLSLAFDTLGQHLLVVSREGSASLMDIQNQQVEWETHLAGDPIMVRLSANQRRLFAVTSAQKLVSYTIGQDGLIQDRDYVIAGLEQFLLLPQSSDGHYLFGVAPHSGLVFIDNRRKQMHYELEQQISSVALSASGMYAAVGMPDAVQFYHFAQAELRITVKPLGQLQRGMFTPFEMTLENTGAYPASEVHITLSGPVDAGRIDLADREIPAGATLTLPNLSLQPLSGGAIPLTIQAEYVDDLGLLTRTTTVQTLNVALE